MNAKFFKYKLSNLIAINKIVSIHYYEYSKRFEFKGESHDFWEIVYVDKGDLTVGAGSREILLKQGEAVFHKPNEFHTLHANGVTAPNLFIISFVCHSKAMDFYKNKTLYIPPKCRKFIAQILEESEKTFVYPCEKRLILKDDAPAGGQQLIKCYLEQFLIMLLRTESEKKENKIFPSKTSVENYFASSVIKLLEDHLYGKITVQEICERLNFSRAYVANVFKKNTGYSVSEYYARMKISEAKKLIREENYNFTQISEMLHFDTPNYFSRAFKRITGMTPSEYRASVKVD
mgnify:FL=1